jgi:DNA polymerase
MRLNLDTRQRAILQEMGVHVWWPRTHAKTNPSSRLSIPPVAPIIVADNALSTGVSANNGAQSERSAKGLNTSIDMPLDTDLMDWPALTQTIRTCHACPLCVGRRIPVFEAWSDLAVCRSDWLVLGEPPEEEEERVGAPFAAQAGQLLNNMLQAVGVQARRAGRSDTLDLPPEKAAYLTNVVKCRPAVARNPTPQELAICGVFLRREIALVQPKVILALGRYAAQALLQSDLEQTALTPLGKLRGQTHHYHSIPVIVSYPLSYLLRSPAEKARAWLDLCRAQATLTNR